LRSWCGKQFFVALHELPVYLKETIWIYELIDALRANKFSDIKIEYLAFGASAIATARKGT
jgi:hypothetical protein